MEVETFVVVLASFVGGGAMGATGMLLCQWVVRKMSPPLQPRLDLMDPRDLEAMKADVADLAVRLHSVDARLDFTEQLLGGALSGTRPPESLPPPQVSPPQVPPAQSDLGVEVDASTDGEIASSDEESASTDRDIALPDGEIASPGTEATSPERVGDSSEGENAFEA